MRALEVLAGLLHVLQHFHEVMPAFLMSKVILVNSNKSIGVVMG